MDPMGFVFQEYGANTKLRDEGGLLPVHSVSWYITGVIFQNYKVGPLPVISGRGRGGSKHLSNIFYFHPENWGRFPIWRAYFSDGLKPPTTKVISIIVSIISTASPFDTVLSKAALRGREEALRMLISQDGTAQKGCLNVPPRRT